ncbi:hypothetical protein O181_009962 [Austropuccinia psidii MF-1]|uniref:Uncharacterized protein n=1 Tax=Austropuccinia psidii MF-1 TaxID=1389203 RepID=A0A9Q3GKS0_9BASI|nr:hypothetical protein [Austropuccinia psidii MF-1]
MGRRYWRRPQKQMKNRELSTGMLGTALNGEEDVIFHKISFTRLKIIEAHNRIKFYSQGDLQQNFTSKGQFYRKELELINNIMEQEPKGTLCVKKNHPIELCIFQNQARYCKLVTPRKVPPLRLHTLPSFTPLP